jgi:Domain of unknown function (DUF4402)
MKTLLQLSYSSRLTPFVFSLIVLCVCGNVRAQQPPPRPISVSFNPSLGLRFGGVFLGTTGGTVTVAPDGSRTSTGGVVLAGLGFLYGAANFEIVANPGTLVSILNGPDATLTGSAGGSMTMHIGTSSPPSPFITSATPPGYTSVNIGGTLTVGTATSNPAGSYSGSFLVTFIQE